MNRTSRLAATALTALLIGAPAGFAATGLSSTTGSAPQSSQGTNDTSAPSSNAGSMNQKSPTAGQNQGMNDTSNQNSSGSASGQSGGSEQLSQSTLENVQQQLQQQGYYKNAKVDGKWGPRTREAVTSFQQAKGLPATGQLDQQTLSALGVNQGG